MIKITQKENCTGCHTCVNICPKQCISMVDDSEGFWYPQTDSANCINCGLCEQICPILHKAEVMNTPVAYAAYNKDEAIRLASSSGGLFTLLAERVIDDGGVVFGAHFDNEFNVVHSYSSVKEDLGQFRGSKYVQSKIGDNYKKAKELLQSGRIVLFTGTPCQIGGLKAYLQKDYENLICQDIICHGVPSPKVWGRYVQYREKCAGASVRKINFKQKKTGWKRYSISFKFKNDLEYTNTFDKDLIMIAFLKNICLRPSCHHCAYKTLHRQSDITLADFWGIQYLMPEMDDDKGTSLIFVNTSKGQALFNLIKDNLIYKQANIYEAVHYNPAATTSVKIHPKRNQFFKKLDTMQFDRLVRRYVTVSFTTKCNKLLHRVLSRIHKSKANA